MHNKHQQIDLESKTTRLLTGKQASQYLGIRYKTLWEWVKKGIIAQVKIPGAKAKYDIWDLKILIERSKQIEDVSVQKVDEMLAEITNQIRNKG